MLAKIIFWIMVARDVAALGLVLTLDHFIFVLNGLLLWFVASFIKGFTIDSFWTAMFGAMAYNLSVGQQPRLF